MSIINESWTHLVLNRKPSTLEALEQRFLLNLGSTWQRKPQILASQNLEPQRMGVALDKTLDTRAKDAKYSDAASTRKANWLAHIRKRSKIGQILNQSSRHLQLFQIKCLNRLPRGFEELHCFWCRDTVGIDLRAHAATLLQSSSCWVCARRQNLQACKHPKP